MRFPTFALLSFCLVFASCFRQLHDVVINLPAGFKGWVEITYSSSCPLAAETEERRVLNVGADGRLCVGSKWEEGDGTDQFYYVVGAHRELLHEDTPRVGMIWGRAIGQNNLGPERIEKFFVGTEAEYRRETLGDRRPGLSGVRRNAS